MGYQGKTIYVSTQLRFLHNWVITGIQNMDGALGGCWFTLVEAFVMLIFWLFCHTGAEHQLFVSSPGIVLRIHELPPFNLTLSLSLSLCLSVWQWRRRRRRRIRTDLWVTPKLGGFATVGSAGASLMELADQNETLTYQNHHHWTKGSCEPELRWVWFW